MPRCTKMHLYHIFGLLIVVSDSCHLVRGEISRNQNSQITSDQQHQAKEKVLLSLQQIGFFLMQQNIVLVINSTDNSPQRKCSTTDVLHLLRKTSLESVFGTTFFLWKAGLGVAASAASGSCWELSSRSATLKRFSVTMALVLSPETHTVLNSRQWT